MNKKKDTLEAKINRNIPPENISEVKCDLSFTKKTILWEAMDALLKPSNKPEHKKTDH